MQLGRLMKWLLKLGYPGWWSLAYERHTTCAGWPPFYVQASEFAVVVLPFGSWGDRIGRVPVLDDLTIGYAK